MKEVLAILLSVAGKGDVISSPWRVSSSPPGGGGDFAFMEEHLGSLGPRSLACKSVSRANILEVACAGGRAEMPASWRISSRPAGAGQVAGTVRKPPGSGQLWCRSGLRAGRGNSSRNLRQRRIQCREQDAHERSGRMASGDPGLEAGPRAPALSAPGGCCPRVHHSRRPRALPTKHHQHRPLGSSLCFCETASLILS